jgi:hypothetical protein
LAFFSNKKNSTNVSFLYNSHFDTFCARSFCTMSMVSVILPLLSVIEDVKHKHVQ